MQHPFTDIHTHTPCPDEVCVVSVRLLKTGQEYPELCTAGIHPWDVEMINPIIKKLLLSELASSTYIKGIGETGLDYACNANRALQEELFEDQLEIASERGLPVTIHCVRAFEPVMKILERYKLRAVIFHGFIGSREQAITATKSGYYISYGQRSLKSPKTIEAMRATPCDRLFLETDDDTVKIREIYELAARELGVTIDKLAETTYKNFKTVFG